MRSDAEVFRLFSLQKNNLAARILDDVLKRNPVRNRQNDLVAVVDQHLNRVEERELAAGRKDGLFRRVIRAEIACVTLDDRLTQLWNTGYYGVAREILIDGIYRRVFNVARGGEVGFARSEVDQFGALGAQFGGFCSHGHRGRNLNASDAIGKNLGGSRCCHVSIFSDFCRMRGRKCRKSVILSKYRSPNAWRSRPSL